MNRIAPLLLALGLACLIGQLGGDFGEAAPPGEVDATTVLILAIGFLATLLGSANLVRRRS